MKSFLNDDRFRIALIKYVQDLCNAALRFGFDTLRTGGHFVCKYYQGAEEKALETRLRALFAKVHREKPESSRSVGWHTSSCTAND